MLFYNSRVDRLLIRITPNSLKEIWFFKLARFIATDINFF